MEAPRIRIIELFFLLILIALTFGFYMVMQPFVLDIFLAAIFTAILFPAHERLVKRLSGRSTLASTIMVLMSFFVVVVPVGTIGVLVYSEAVQGYNAVINQLPSLSARISEISVMDWASGLPIIGDYLATLEPVDLSETLRNAVRTGSNFVLEAGQRSFVSVSAALINFIMVLILMFFFFETGRRLLATIYNIVPMPNRELREIAQETRRTTTATLISTLIIGLIEGSFGTILFAIFGLPSPFLWGIIITVLSMIPLIGTNLVIIPAGIILLITGRIFAGIALVVLGIGGVAVTQNVIKPKLLGDRSGLHPALALLSTIGGIAWLGIIGFLVGPLVAALFILLWQQFAKRYRSELATRNG
jgi:predicted PurR-regulated permease PerM